MPNIYDNIKKICDERGISISSLERQAGLSKASICKWNESSPTVENIKAVADVLKEKVDKLIR